MQEDEIISTAAKMQVTGDPVAPVPGQPTPLGAMVLLLGWTVCLPKTTI